MLFTGGYRDFEEKIRNNEYYEWWKFDKYDYDIFFILSDDIEIIQIKKQMKFIKSFFGDKLKLVTSLFIDEESKNKYYENYTLIKKNNDSLKKEVYDYYYNHDNKIIKNNIDFFTDKNRDMNIDLSKFGWEEFNVLTNQKFWNCYYDQFYKLHLAHQKVYENINPDDYNLFIRLRPDLTLMKFKEVRSGQLKNIDDIFNIKENLIKENNTSDRDFAFMFWDFCGFYSYNSFKLESNVIFNMFHGYKKKYPICHDSFKKLMNEKMSVIHPWAFRQEWNLWNILNDYLGRRLKLLNGNYHTFIPRYFGPPFNSQPSEWKEVQRTKLK